MELQLRIPSLVYVLVSNKEGNQFPVVLNQGSYYDAFGRYCACHP